MATKTMKIGLSDADKASMKSQIVGQLFEAYSSSKTYEVGDFVSKDGVIYKCITAITTAEAWNSSHWTTATLNEITDKFDEKANVNGNYPTLTVGLSNNLTPYSKDSGAEQDNPFISNGTGTNNNTEIVTVGDYGLFKEKQGNSIVVNQLVQNGDFSNGTTGWTAVRGTISANNNICSYIVTELGGADTTNRITKFVSLVANHKYLCFATIKAPHDTIFNFTLNSSGDIVNVNTNISCVANTKKYALILLSPTANITGLFIRSALGNYNYNVNDIIEFSDIGIVDLTQMFNGDIPQDLLDHPEHFSWYYNGSLAYNTSTLDNGDGVKLVSTGRNLWDEEWKLNENNRVCSKNLIKVVPNSTIYWKAPALGTIHFYDKDNNSVGYYDGYNNRTVTIPENCVAIDFIMGSGYGSTYNHDITISLYYSPEQGGEGYDKYYAYEEPHITNTGTETLRSAGSVKDSKLPSGEIIRRIGVVDLGTLTWEYNASGVFLSGGSSSSWSVPDAKIDLKNAVCTKYVFNGNANSSSASAMANSLTDKQMCSYINADNKNRLVVKDSSGGTDAVAFKSSLSGVYLFYELAEPTTEQGTDFSENLPINDYGMLYWLDSSDNLVGVPQGCKIFYPVNYKGFVDDVYARTDGDASKLVLQSELSSFLTVTDYSNNITDDCGLTYLLKKAYVIGKIGFISIVAKNETGSTITAQKMFTISSGLNTADATYFRHAGMKDTSFFAFSNGGDGKFYASSDIENNATIYINISYPVA